MFQRMHALFAHESGQTRVEFGLILSLISVVSIGTMGLIGGDVTAMFIDIRDKVVAAMA